DPFADLARALGRALAQASFELLDRRRDEDRDRTRLLLLDRQRALRLELEQRHVAVPTDPPQLGAERSVAVARDVLDLLEELVRLDSGQELLERQETVLAAVGLPRPPVARRRRDGRLELGHLLEQLPDQRSLPGARGAGHDEQRGPTG